MNRKITILVVFLFFTFQASANVFGTFPQQLEKNSDTLSTEIGLGVINAGNSDLIIEFSSPETEEYDMSLPKRVTLEPSSVTKTPEGEGWYYLGDGRYAEYEEFSFDVEISEYRQSNTVHVPLQISANSETAEGTAPVNRFREYNYTVHLNPRLRPLSREGDESDEPLYWEEESSVPEEWGEDEQESEKTSSNSSERSEDYKSGQEQESTGESGGPEAVTLALVTGIALTAIYIIKVT